MNNIIGNRINESLAARNIKQKELAQEVRVKDNVVSYWCNGSRIPNTEQITKIAKYLDVSTDYLLGNATCKNADLGIEEIHQLTALSEKAITKLIEIPKQLGIDDYIGDSEINALNILIESNMFWDILSYIDLMLKSSDIDTETKEELNPNIESITLKGKAMGDYFRNNAVNTFSFLIDDIRKLRSVKDE